MIAEILRSALAAIERGETLAIATIIEAEGSSPGKPGHKMILYPDGRQEGTVGGGMLEVRAKKEILEMIRRGRGGVLTYTFDPDSPESIGMLCGGKAILAVEVIVPAARILLCGGGHVAQAFARQCRELGFVHSVVDAREAVVSNERFPEAVEIACERPPDYLQRASLDCFSHVLIFTHDHALDRETLHAVYQKGFEHYIGLIGSSRKWAAIRKALVKAGVAEDWLDRVHCPIGLDIGAHTPVEIAISIAAEIVKETRAEE